MTTVALVAAKDAAATIADTVTALRRLVPVDEVWVIDDGSEDETAAVAREHGARVVRCERNRGKGGAIAAGVAATPHATRYLLADADLGATAAGLAPLLEAEGDLVVGVLPAAEGRGGFGMVKSIAAAGIHYASGAVMHAPLSGQRVVRGDLLRSLALAPRFGVEVGMTIDALASGAVVREVPVDVDHHHRGRGIGGFSHRARQGIDVVGAVASRIWSTRQRVAAAVVAAVVTFAALSTIGFVRRAPAGQALPGASQVVLFAFDGLELADVSNPALPNLRRLRPYSAIGALSVRTTDRRRLANRDGAERPSLSDAYASVGASARVRWAGSMPASRSRARADSADSAPGALGDALRAAGKHTALVTARPGDASAAVADRRGRVDTVVAGGVPWRARLDAALRRAPVVMVEPDPASADAQLGEVFEVLPRGTLLIVFSPTPPGEQWQLTPVFAASAGVDGPVAIASATTRRPALAGIVDLAPTVLTALGLDVPASMTGAPLRMTDAPPDLAALQRLEVDGAVRSRFFLGAAVGYTVIGLAFYLAFMASLRRGVGRQARRIWRVGVCALGAFPLASLVIGAVQHFWHVGGESPVFLAFVSAALGAVVAGLRGVGPVFVLAAATLAVIVLDVAATGPLHASSILGYSIQTTGRYYGLPNASFAVYAASLFLVAAAVAGRRPTRVQAAAASALLATGVAFVAAPWLGNDVGGTVALLPLALAAAWAWFGHRFTARVVVVGGVLVLVAVAALAVAQALGAETHLGRAAARDASFLNTMTRRVEANVGLLVDQWWGFLSMAFAAAALVLLRPPERFGAYLPAGSGLRIATVATLALSLLGFAVNDSGPVVNVLCLAVLAPALALNALSGGWRVTDPAR